MRASNTEGPSGHGRAILLLAKSAFAAAPHREMGRIAHMASMLPDVAHATYCFSEQGTPSIRDALLELRDGEYALIVVVPLMVPVEPGFANWLPKAIRRWQTEASGRWPPIQIARDPAQSLHFEVLLASLVAAAGAMPATAPHADVVPEASVVPAQKRRVLVCQGAECNSRGADVVWGHFRNIQHERKLRTRGDGTMSAKSTCLGPCALAPVVQVLPEGTYYGGVTERRVDRIVEEHLLGGRVVEEFASPANGRKQRLRPPPRDT